jgi:hypothetical protein
MLAVPGAARVALGLVELVAVEGAADPPPAAGSPEGREVMGGGRPEPVPEGAGAPGVFAGRHRPEDRAENLLDQIVLVGPTDRAMEPPAD